VSVCSRTRSRFEVRPFPAQRPGVHLEPPSAQSPFAFPGRYPSKRGVQRHVGGRYSSFVAHTGSCVRPTPSRLLWLSLVWRVFAGCCQPLLVDGPSRRYLCGSFPGCLDLSHGGPRGAHGRYFPPGVGLPRALPTGRQPTTICFKRLHAGPHFAGCRHSLRSGLQVCLPPRSSPPLRISSARRPWR
jgi:hypothetical protein